MMWWHSEDTLDSCMIEETVSYDLFFMKQPGLNLPYLSGPGLQRGSSSFCTNVYKNGQGKMWLWMKECYLKSIPLEARHQIRQQFMRSDKCTVTDVDNCLKLPDGRCPCLTRYDCTCHHDHYHRHLQPLHLSQHHLNNLWRLEQPYEWFFTNFNSYTL